MALLLDKLVLRIDPDLFTFLTVFSVSVLLVNLDLSNDLTLSDLLLLDLSTFLFDACYFSVLMTVSIFFFEMGVVVDSFTALYFSHFSIPFFDNCVGSSDQCLFGFI